jgi:2-keto-4-pentenoate hydratase/2-oxohepta-3-ene-1,7-dioic acid hydratase in catechol pathway
MARPTELDALISLEMGDVINSGSVDEFNNLVEDKLIEKKLMPERAILEDIDYEVAGVGDSSTEVRVRVMSGLVYSDEDDEA